MVSYSPAIPSTGLDELVTAVRQVVDKRVDWQRTARLVTRELERHLPSPDVLTAEQRNGDAEGTAPCSSTSAFSRSASRTPASASRAVCSASRGSRGRNFS
jgi:hypothetical protein